MSRQNSTASRRSRAESPAPLSSGYSHPHSYSQSHLADGGFAGYFPARPTPGGGGGGGGAAVASQHGVVPHQLGQHGAGAGAMSTTMTTMTTTSELSPGLMQATSRYEETAFYRSELESVKRENEALKRQVRELERMVRERRASDASRTRSESVSTTASVSGARGGTSIVGRRARERDRAASSLSTAGGGTVEGEVRVGESAASAGLGTQDGARD
jgi:hypothetical protein